MMKKYLNILSVIAVLVMTFSFYGCGGDDDNNEPDVPENVDPLIGTWTQSEDGINCRLTFNSDHSGSITMTQTENVETSDTKAGVTITMTETFNWSVSVDSSSNKWLETIHTGGDVIFGTGSVVYMLANNTLAIDNWGTFRKL
jgi:lipoprotein